MTWREMQIYLRCILLSKIFELICTNFEGFTAMICPRRGATLTFVIYNFSIKFFSALFNASIFKAGKECSYLFEALNQKENIFVHKIVSAVLCLL